VIDQGEIVIDGDRISGFSTVEGPKLYKRDGYYYVFAPAGGVRDGYQVVFRSRDIRGPYEHRIVLATGRTAINGPHQGAWVTSSDGGDWFLHFQELPVYGRVMHLQPMRWSNNWPVLGHNPEGQGPGEPVASHRKPLLHAAKPNAPPTSDEFESSALGRQWQWQANPQRGWCSLTDAPGALRLACVPQRSSETLWHAGHLLMQKFPAPDFVATTQVRFSPGSEGARGGLLIFGHDYAWLGLRYARGCFRLVLVSCDSAHKDAVENELHGSDLPGDLVFLRVTVSSGGRCRFSFSIDAAEYHTVGEEFQATSSTWVGAKIGLFASAPEGVRPGGHLDVRWFRITPVVGRERERVPAVT
jgi:beta-xylosidase